MKLRIEKLPSGKFKVTLATASDRKPIVFETTVDQITMLARIIENAANTSTFEFCQWEGTSEDGVPVIAFRVIFTDERDKELA